MYLVRSLPKVTHHGGNLGRVEVELCAKCKVVRRLSASESVVC